MRRDDPFAVAIAPRLLRIDRELESAVLDAQCRDWAADRPDRVRFARLGQARQDVSRAARCYHAVRPRTDVPAMLAAAATWVLTAGLLLGPAGLAGRPLTLAAAVAAALWAATAAAWGLRRRRAARARRRVLRSPAIDDLYLYAGLRRRIEACAVAARSDRSLRRRAAAADLEHALDWLTAAQEELPRRW